MREAAAKIVLFFQLGRCRIAFFQKYDERHDFEDKLLFLCQKMLITALFLWKKSAEFVSHY